MPDASSFEVRCLPLLPHLRRIAGRLCSRDDAHDLVQETMLRAARSWDSFCGDDPKPWLCRIMRNAFLNDYRARHRHERLFAKFQGDFVQACHARDLRAGEDMPSASVMAAIDQLQELGKVGERYREVVLRADLRGEKYKEIAASLDIPIGTVMSCLHRARRLLRAELADLARSEYGLSAQI